VAMRVWLLADQYLEVYQTILAKTSQPELEVSATGTDTDAVTRVAPTYSQAEGVARVQSVTTSGRSTPEHQERSRSASRIRSKSISSVSSSPPELSTQHLVGSVVDKAHLSSSIVTVQRLNGTLDGRSEVNAMPSSISVRGGLHFSASRERGRKMPVSDGHDDVNELSYAKEVKSGAVVMDNDRKKDEALKSWLDTHHKIMEGVLEGAVDRVRTCQCEPGVK
jgi:hypothetical protein